MSRSGLSRASSGAPRPTFRESLIGDGELTQCDFVFTSLFCIATDKSELIDGHHIKPRRQANRSVHTPFIVILQITKSHVFYVRSINISLFSHSVKTCMTCLLISIGWCDDSIVFPLRPEFYRSLIDRPFFFLSFFLSFFIFKVSQYLWWNSDQVLETVLLLDCL